MSVTLTPLASSHCEDPRRNKITRKVSPPPCQASPDLPSCELRNQKESSQIWPQFVRTWWVSISWRQTPPWLYYLDQCLTLSGEAECRLSHLVLNKSEFWIWTTPGRCLETHCEVSLHKYLTRKYFKVLEKSREIVSFGENPMLCPFKCVVWLCDCNVSTWCCVFQSVKQLVWFDSF